MLLVGTFTLKKERGVGFKFWLGTIEHAKYLNNFFVM
jgi:hypothetical protein